MKLWLKGAKQILQVVSDGREFLTGEAMRKLAILEADGAERGLSIIIDEYVMQFCTSKRSSYFSMQRVAI